MFGFKVTRLIATKLIDKANIYVRFVRFWPVWISVAQADSLRLEFLAGYQPAPLAQPDSLTSGGKRIVATDRPGASIAW